MRYLRSNGLHEIDIFKNYGFSQFLMVLDSEMKDLQSARIGAIHRKVEPINFEEEEISYQKRLQEDHVP